ncbi:plasmid pRiA4b ORF-3 family protein [Elizabethkingia sp. JS20170427COW]|uniref:plasmid pRiA4b ORF-3 family protein n=1 Tax=Elizabethkingia sp. JS20170427COW TaxID=2583851 RepID=UPI001110A295|nr:plasmid pRiA4b ORF-3 family protein [Elizabethkingia sp. JS20170427COW]QCX52587.1 plasmid pRiA4b ORF-3 family protein [Elizabethkingia sp. JS20170427COW]
MIYKVRVILDAKDSIFRDIEIKGKQTLWNLHQGIKSAFSLQGDELSSFYYSDEEWTEGQAIPLEDMSDNGDGEIMSDIYISEAFAEKGSKMLFKYGFIDLWEFFCELQEIIDEKPSVNYPITTFRFGNMPLKAPSKSGSGKSAAILDDDFASIDSDYKGDDFDDFDDEEEDDGYADDLYDAEDLDRL